MNRIIYVLIVFFIILFLFLVLYELNQTNHYFGGQFPSYRIYHPRSKSYVVLRLATPNDEPVKTVRGGEEALKNAYVPALCVGGSATDPFGLWQLNPDDSTNPRYYALFNTFIKSYCSQSLATFNLYNGPSPTNWFGSAFNYVSTKGTPTTQPNRWFIFKTASLQPVIVDDTAQFGASLLFTIESLDHPGLTYRWVQNMTQILSLDDKGADEFQLRPPIVPT